ncbi:MAG: imidazole glycerol phosphate synthase subunit HisH [Thermodesulfobacteriota bacterium]|nr:imidazole glycerol phosphate synthase subunit HisH [Thermodesulfobacteriota bacterium]
MLVIIDYGMGNLRSVQKGLEQVGFNARLTNSPEIVRDATGIILPGVGAFGDCIKSLKKLGLFSILRESINRNIPYLGICLGYQILFEESEEFGKNSGLGIFRGKVVRFPKDLGLKIPHMGWNRVCMKKDNFLFQGIPKDSYFYFVHSYYPIPEDKKLETGTTEYGIEFKSCVFRGNLFACQFHPEKSQDLGLKLLYNFGKLVSRKS